MRCSPSHSERDYFHWHGGFAWYSLLFRLWLGDGTARRVRPWAEQRAAILALARGLWSMSPTDARPCFDAMCAHCALQLQRGREMFFLQRRPPVSCRPILPWTLPGARPTNFAGSAPSLRAYARHRRFHHCCRSSRAGRRYLRTLAKANGSRRKQRATRQEYPRHGPQAIPGRGVDLLALQLRLW